MEGWIKIHRSISEHWIWKDPVKLKWWLDILLNVNHCDNKVNMGYNLYECKRGQSIMSLQTWAERWNCNKDAARNFLKLLEKDGMILHENITKSTRITVCNYDQYQSDLHANQTQTKRKPNANQTHSDPNKNDKNEKNIMQSFEFYKNEVELAKKYNDQMSLDYVAYCRHVCMKNKDGTWRLPEVLKMKNQISINDFAKLYDKSGKNLDEILSKVDSLQTNIKYHGKYIDVYLTINRWLNPRK